MSKFVKWGSAFKKAIHLKLARGATPEQLKNSFSDLVNSLQTPEQKLKSAEAEIKRLRSLLEKKNRGTRRSESK